MKFNDKVYALCKKIPRGKVTTYKEIGRCLNTKAYRAIGNALRKNPYAPKIPCHRVVRSDGSVGGYEGKTNSKKKKEMLRKEGMLIRKNEIIDFKKVLFEFD